MGGTIQLLFGDPKSAYLHAGIGAWCPAGSSKGGSLLLLNSKECVSHRFLRITLKTLGCTTLNPPWPQEAARANFFFPQHSRLIATHLA